MGEESKELEPASVVELMTKGEIESQIDIAKRWPRSMATFKKRALDMATIDEETAASCIYHRPVGKEGGKVVYAEGMSVRSAEILGASYGNLRVYATILSQTERQVVARGMAIDLEANFASSSEVVESTVKRDGTPYDERMRAVVAKAALAKARRDATFQVVPRALWRPIEAEVKKILIGDAKSLDTRRKAISEWIKSLGIDPKRVYLALGVNGIEDVGIDQIETLTGVRTAIKEGDVTIDEAFPPEPLKEPKAKEKNKEDETKFNRTSESRGTKVDLRSDDPKGAKRDVASSNSDAQNSTGNGGTSPKQGTKTESSEPKAEQKKEEFGIEAKIQAIQAMNKSTFIDTLGLAMYLKGLNSNDQTRICAAYNTKKIELGL